VKKGVVLTTLNYNMRESGQNKRDYDVMMDNNGCYSPIDHNDDSEGNVKKTKNINDIQTQVLSPPNSEPVSSCTIVNSGSNSSTSHSQSSNENEEDDKTEINEIEDSKQNKEKEESKDDTSKPIKQENIDTKLENKIIENDSSNKSENSIKNENKTDEMNTDKKENEEQQDNKEEEEKEKTHMPPEHVKICTSILRNIKRHHDSGPFLKPVDPVALGIPDYFTIIHHPMDISTIESKLKSSTYKNIDEFIDDFTLMFKNCYEYNGTQQPVSLMAKKFRNFI